MQLYRFSPIRTKGQFEEAAQYVIRALGLLAQKVTGQTLPVSYLSVFAHYPDEYEGLEEILKEMGSREPANNGFRILLKERIGEDGISVASVRVRKPDPYRMQAGCGDFMVPNYAAFKEKHLARNPGNLRVIERPDYEMIEFFDPDLDVLGYAVSKK